MQDAGGELSRTTVRLFNELKSQAERAASDQGVSLNTYISRAVSDSVRSAVPNKGGHRGRGPAVTPAATSPATSAADRVTGLDRRPSASTDRHPAVTRSSTDEDLPCTPS